MTVRGKIEKPQELSKHLQFLSDYQIHCRLISASRKIIAKGALLFHKDTERLQFSPSPLDWFDHDTASIGYGYGAKAYIFRTKPTGVEKGSLLLRMPTSVSYFDRRNNFRVTPSKNGPVSVRLLLPDKPEIRTNAEDISGDGFSVVLPRHFPISGVGMTFPATLLLPNEEKITTQATVKWQKFFMGAMWMGCHLSHIEESDQNRIVSYCLREQLNKTNIPPEDRQFDPKKSSVCIIDSKLTADKYAYLKELFTFEVVSNVKAIARLRQHCPALIVLNADHAGSKLILQALNRDRMLKSLPLIIIGKHRKIGSRPGPVIKVSTPFKKSFLIRTLMEAIEKIEHSNRVSRSCYRFFSGEGKKIAVVDPKNNLDRNALSILEGLDYSLHWIQKEHGIMEQASEIRPDLLLIENDTGELDAATLCRLFNLNNLLKPPTENTSGSRRWFFKAV